MSNRVNLTSRDQSYENQLIFKNDSGQRILTKVVGLTTYGNMALHGFGYAYVLSALIRPLSLTNRHKHPYHDH